MYQMAIIGVAWGLGLWALWTGYFLVWSPRIFRNFVLRKKYRVIMCDLAITILGSRLMLTTGGSVTAGIGTFVLMFSCFLSSSLVIMILRAKELIGGLGGGRRVYRV